MRRPHGARVGVVALLVALVGVALAADLVSVEDWSSYPLGTQGLPGAWQRQRWGNPAYDFTVVEDGGQRAIRLRSAADSSNMSREIKGRVNLKATPILVWSWKAVTLPRGGDSRHKETDDQAAQLYVSWPRFPEAVRSRIIGYVWDTTAPAGTIVKSQKTGTVTYVVVRSGSAQLGQWLAERRNVRDDFRQIYGEEPDEPAVLSVGIDSDDVQGTAEALIGPIAFRRP